VLTILNAGLIVVSVATLVTARRADWTAHSDPEPVSRFSSRMNVLVLLLDGLESGVAERVLAADPSLKASFDGFSFYPDTLSTAPTTALSLPAIHSGEVYDGKGAAREYFSEAIRWRSFLTQFAHAGYEVSLVHPAQGICPDGLTTCTTLASVLGTADRQVRREVLRLFDLSLLRIVPFRAKRWVWDQGRWRASRQAGVPEEIARLIESNEMIDRIGRRLTVDPDALPTLKFLHSLATHAPYVMNEDCRTVTMGPTSPPTRVDVQARCALRAVAQLLDRLRGAGIYDNTITLVLADHGMSPAYPRPQDQAAAFRQLSGSANPLFLYKPLRSRGPMRTERAVVSLVDVGATLCADASACTMRSGVPVGRAPARRPRRFNDYVWQHRFWRTLNVERVTPYEVRGPLGQPGSWHRLQ
jgi:Sulfatase